MLQSMTAFGQSVASNEHGEFRWEIRSVNHRHLDVGIRLPDGLRSIDTDLRKIIASRVNRGKVDVSMKYTNTTGALNQLVLDENLLAQLSGVIDQIQGVRIDAGRFDPVHLLNWPGLVSSSSAVDESVAQAATDSFSEALDDFLQARTREGQQIGEMLGGRAAQLCELVSTLRVHRPSVVSRQREKLLAKLAQLDAEPDAGRLEQELVYAAQRLDIDEELDRLDAHLHELSLVLVRDEAVGRRLDFLMQELNREANTVASKANDSATTAASIDMKVLIEQMREQIQNVE